MQKLAPILHVVSQRSHADTKASHADLLGCNTLYPCLISCLSDELYVQVAVLLPSCMANQTQFALLEQGV